MRANKFGAQKNFEPRTATHPVRCSIRESNMVKSIETESRVSPEYRDAVGLPRQLAGSTGARGARVDRTRALSFSLVFDRRCMRWRSLRPLRRAATRGHTTQSVIPPGCLSTVHDNEAWFTAKSAKRKPNGWSRAMHSSWLWDKDAGGGWGGVRSA